MKANHFNIRFAASQLIFDFKCKDLVSSSDILNFRQDIYQFVKVTVNKILEHFPDGLAIICNANMFDPTKMTSRPTENFHIKARNLLRGPLNLKILTPTYCDNSLSELKDFLRNNVKKLPLVKKEHRLDEFFFSAVPVENYQNLTFILKTVLTLSHHHAAAEKILSINKAVLDVNIQESSLIQIRSH